MRRSPARGESAPPAVSPARGQRPGRRAQFLRRHVQPDESYVYGQRGDRRRGWCRGRRRKRRSRGPFSGRRPLQRRRRDLLRHRLPDTHSRDHDRYQRRLPGQPRPGRRGRLRQRLRGGWDWRKWRRRRRIQRRVLHARSLERPPLPQLGPWWRRRTRRIQRCRRCWRRRARRCHLQCRASFRSGRTAPRRRQSR